MTGAEATNLMNQLRSIDSRITRLCLVLEKVIERQDERDRTYTIPRQEVETYLPGRLDSN